MEIKHVLVIEDASNVLLGLKLNLISLGFEVYCFQNGKIAYEEIVQMKKSGKKFDLLITDIDLPGMNGIDLIEALLQENIKVPAVTISGYSDAELRRKLTTSKKFNFLQKPFTFSELQTHIENALNNEPEDIKTPKKLSGKNEL